MQKTIDEIQNNIPPRKYIPEYYEDKYEKVGTWFKIKEFSKAPSDILGRCTLVSSGCTLSEASRRCVNPFFVIKAPEDN